ncbi:hypothetical protein AB3M89_07965 [Microbacterium sp. 179-I 3D2 NHS]|uniref:hypothetical protein n=1 Tax=Microbacterium sp. 179-I 3D2 NHS TaxID=3235178 RepID=UPI0039A0F061
MAAASALLFAVGLGAGWVFFASRPDAIPLSDDQQQRRDELYASDDYDAGSVRAVGQDDDALVWFGTKDDGAVSCAVIDVGSASSESCRDSDGDDPFVLSASVLLPEPAEAAAVSGTSVNAFVMLSTTGEPMVAIQRWTAQSASLSAFRDEDRARAQELFDEGYELGLSIVGYFGDAPVWIADRATGAVVETCLIVDAAGREQCGVAEDVREDGMSIAVADSLGSVPDSWVITVDYTADRSPYLTIVGDADVSTVRVRDGERMELGGEHGDPIEVTIPSEPAG